MKSIRIGSILISILILCSMVINLTGCAVDDHLSGEENTPRNFSSQDAFVTDFAVSLFRECEESGKNTLISPLSVLCALAMTANGAKAETLAQMESVLGMTTQDLNGYLRSYLQNLPQGEGYKLSLANSIWYTDNANFSVNPGFVEIAEGHYGADIYKVPFDNVTCRDINSWVNEKTDEMIPQIIDQIPPEAILYLINALAFDAQWTTAYDEYQVSQGQFTTEDGIKQDAEFMYDSETHYLKDSRATGFIKYYKGGKYAFVALLPNEGVTVSDYIASMDGESLHELLSNPREETIHTSIPKFQIKYNIKMAEILKVMGMSNAFDPEKADFHGLGEISGKNIYISDVLHKTYICVGEQGTKAGAATAVTIEAAGMSPKKPKEVYLDRPFVYMLIDCQNNIPFFIGTMMDMGQ